MGKWAKSLETRINSGFFVAIFIFKSGQKVGKWPEIPMISAIKKPFSTSKIVISKPKTGKSPLLKYKSGQRN